MRLDSYDNLILLCATDHSLVDQLVLEYPEERLREIKQSHERWVDDRLSPTQTTPVSIHRKVPDVLREVSDAMTLIEIIADADESSLDHEELTSEAEVDEVGSLLQTLHDYGEMWSDFEPADRVSASFEIGRLLKEARERGWRVFGTRARGRLVGGTSEGETAWDTAYLRIVRTKSESIIKIE